MILVGSLVIGVVQSAGVEPAAAASELSSTLSDGVETDLPAAREAALSGGVPVEALSERTETTQVFANPDGTMTKDIAAAPLRVEDTTAADGWRDLNFDLETTSDGTVQPISPLTPVALSGGAATDDAALVTLSTSSGELALDWDGTLPAPTLDGQTATYHDVAENTDLVVTATRYGFEQSFVINEQPADLTDFSLPLSIDSDDLTVPTGDASDGIAISDASDQSAISVSPAYTWDADSDPAVSSDGVVVSDMSVTADGGGSTLQITPDATWLADPDTSYPITVDPTFTNEEVWSDTYVASGASANTNYSNDGYLRAGSDGTKLYRSYLKFHSNLNDIIGATVSSASLRLYQTVANSCTPTNVAVYPVSTNDPDLLSATWNAQPVVYTGAVSNSSSSKGYSSSCPGGLIAADATNAVQYFADHGSDYLSLSVRSSETSSAAYKVFLSANYGSGTPALSITYDRPPSVPTMLRADGGLVGPALGTTTSSLPFMSAEAVDADGTPVSISFEVYSSATGGASALEQSCTSSSGASGTTLGCAASAISLKVGMLYWVRARANSGSATSGWTALADGEIATVFGAITASSISYGAADLDLTQYATQMASRVAKQFGQASPAPSYVLPSTSDGSTMDTAQTAAETLQQSNSFTANLTAHAIESIDDQTSLIMQGTAGLTNDGLSITQSFVRVDNVRATPVNQSGYSTVIVDLYFSHALDSGVTWIEVTPYVSVVDVSDDSILTLIVEDDAWSAGRVDKPENSAVAIASNDEKVGTLATEPPEDGSTTQSGSTTAATTMDWDHRQLVANYARKYWLHYNPSYVSLDNDCTNFVSQALHAGGWRMNPPGLYSDTNYWWYQGFWPIYFSTAWGGAKSFNDFAVNKSGRARLASKPNDLLIGEVLQFDYGEPGANHSMIVTKKVNGQIYLTYHSNNRLDKPFSWVKANTSHNPTWISLATH